MFSSFGVALWDLVSCCVGKPLSFSSIFFQQHSCKVCFPSLSVHRALLATHLSAACLTLQSIRKVDLIRASTCYACMPRQEGSSLCLASSPTTTVYAIRCCRFQAKGFTNLYWLVFACFHELVELAHATDIKEYIQCTAALSEPSVSTVVASYIL